MKDAGYAPDRTTAILDAAITLGLLLIRIVGLARWIGDPRFVPWLGAHGFALGYQITDMLLGAWLCAGVYGGRRWAFVGKALFCQMAILRVLLNAWSPEVLVELAMLGYCLLRLAGLLGPKPVLPPSQSTFMPDRIAASALVAVSGLVFLSYITGIRPVTTTVGPLNDVWLVASMGWVMWFGLGLYQSRQWAILLAAIGSVVGAFALGVHSGDVPYKLFNLLFLLYAVARLAGYGPKVDPLRTHRSF